MSTPKPTKLTQAERIILADWVLGGAEPSPLMVHAVETIIANRLAARTSTATADTGQECPWVTGVHVQRRHCPATADTGLRERVEALIEAGRESLGGTNLMWVSDLEDALDATASAEDRCTEHDPVYDRTIYECGHAHGYCRHCGETTEPCPPTEDRADNEGTR